MTRKRKPMNRGMFAGLNHVVHGRKTTDKLTKNILQPISIPGDLARAYARTDHISHPDAPTTGERFLRVWGWLVRNPPDQEAMAADVDRIVSECMAYRERFGNRRGKPYNQVWVVECSAPNRSRIPVWTPQVVMVFSTRAAARVKLRAEITRWWIAKHGWTRARVRKYAPPLRRLAKV